MKLATLCYIRKNGQTLMIHRTKKEIDDHKDKYNGVGGKFEIGETPEDCAKREIKEETGLKAINLEYKGLLTFPSEFGAEDWYVFVFVINEFEGDLIDCNEGDLLWIDNDKILSLNIHEGDKIFIPWLDQEKMFSAKFIYSQNGSKLEKYEVSFY